MIGVDFLRVSTGGDEHYIPFSAIVTVSTGK